MRESVVEKYLHAEVTKAGGTTRKHKGRMNDPDRIVIWPCGGTAPDIWPARIAFIETKAPGKTARPGQAREHKRLRDLGCTVLVIDTKARVDEYVAENL